MSDLDLWRKIKRPIRAMAPMAGVTDPAFRFMVAKYSKYGGADIGEYGKKEIKTEPSEGPDVIYTEFISASGLFLGDKDSLMEDMRFTNAERPIIAQFFSSDPERMKEASLLASEMGFDGIDINLGCPDRSVCKQGAGSELIRSPEMAQRIVRIVKENSNGLPVSVKTRAGYHSDDELGEWLKVLLDAEPSALVLHARTAKDMYAKPARWELVREAVKIRDQLKSNTLILGNGDISSLEDLHLKVEYSEADGAMVGRALLGNPWFFSSKKVLSGLTVRERLRVLVEHCQLFEKLSKDRKSFAFMRKHFKSYVSGWSGAKELRTRLMGAESAGEVESIIEEYLKKSL
ncbi:MAG: tRNA dihydrouridine synthase [Patescibacteria group bacterium]